MLNSLSNTSKMILGGLTVVPAAAVAGSVLRDYVLASKLDDLSSSEAPASIGVQARVMQLAQERQKLLTERDLVDGKILSLERRMGTIEANRQR